MDLGLNEYYHLGCSSRVRHKKGRNALFLTGFHTIPPAPPPSPRTQLILYVRFSKRTVTESHRALHCLPTESHKIFTALVTVLATILVTTVATILVTNVVTAVVKLSPTLGARIVVTQKSRNRPVFRSLHSVTVSFPEKSFFYVFFLTFMFSPPFESSRSCVFPSAAVKGVECDLVGRPPICRHCATHASVRRWAEEMRTPLKIPPPMLGP